MLSENQHMITHFRYDLTQRQIQSNLCFLLSVFQRPSLLSGDFRGSSFTNQKEDTPHSPTTYTTCPRSRTLGRPTQGSK